MGCTLPAPFGAFPRTATVPSAVATRLPLALRGMNPSDVARARSNAGSNALETIANDWRSGKTEAPVHLGSCRSAANAANVQNRWSGRCGIRTHGDPKGHNGFRGRPIRPLWQPSAGHATGSLRSVGRRPPGPDRARRACDVRPARKAASPPCVLHGVNPPSFHPWAMLHSDPSSVKGASLDKAAMRRAVGFARPYRRLIVAFVTIVVIEALLALVPPILFGRIIDDGIAEGSRRTVDGAVRADHRGLGVRCRARPGRAVVLLEGRRGAHLRPAQRALRPRAAHAAGVLHEHADRRAHQPAEQRRGRRAAGRHRHARHGRRPTSSPWSPRSPPCSLLDWRLTLLALALLPLFSGRPSGSGARLQAITREGMELNADMNTQMTERFSVAGRPCSSSSSAGPTPRRPQLPRPGRAGPGHRRAQRHVRAGCSSPPSASSAPSAPPPCTGSAASWSSPAAITLGTLVAMALLVTRVYEPLTGLTNARVDVHDRLRVLRAGLRGARHAPSRIADAPRRRRALADPQGRVDLDRRVVPLPAAAGLDAGLAGDGPTAASGEPATRAPRRRRSASSPGPVTALVGPSGAGKSTLASLVPRLYDVTAGAVRVDGHDVRDLTQDSLRAAIGVVTQDPHLFHDTVARQPALRPARRHRRRARGGLPRGPHPRRHRRPARRLRHGRRASGATGCRAARSSGWPSPACC